MRSTSRGQGREGNRPSEGRPGKSRERMNKNPIQGRPGRVSWHNTAKPFDSIREVNEVVARRRTAFLPGEIPWRKCLGKSAEAIVPAETPGRAELVGGLPTAERIQVPITSEGMRLPVSAAPMGSMGGLGRRLRATPYGGGQPWPSDRNRPVRTRTPGGVGLVAG